MQFKRRLLGTFRIRISLFLLGHRHRLSRQPRLQLHQRSTSAATSCLSFADNAVTAMALPSSVPACGSIAEVP